MHKIKEILRLFHEGRYSNRQIATAIGLPKSTICDYLKRVCGRWYQLAIARRYR